MNRRKTTRGSGLLCSAQKKRGAPSIFPKRSHTFLSLPRWLRKMNLNGCGVLCWQRHMSPAEARGVCEGSGILTMIDASLEDTFLGVTISIIAALSALCTIACFIISCRMDGYHETSPLASCLNARAEFRRHDRTR